MKVFDFTTGKKGDQVGEISRPTWLSGSLDSGGQRIVTTTSGIEFHAAAGRHEPINPADFGVQAICFCYGQVHRCGTPTDEWLWAAIGTDDWRAAALADGRILIQKKK